MSLEPQNVPEDVPEEGLGSLRGCLVEGDAGQRSRERHVRRRALAISIVLQCAVLAALILLPLFGKPQRIAYAYATPVPPYSPYRNATHNSGAPRPHPNGRPDPCRFCAPTNIPPTIVTRDSTSPAGPPEGIGDSIPGAIDGLIPLSDSRQRVLTPPNTERQATRPQVVRMTQLDPAMLIHRVEPVYPPLAKQTHREGRVELRAIIGTDGTVRSLEIVAGDPLLERSAVEAVQQWRYKPTILNGQAVEIDTYITVIYTMQH
jgi:protein TonB